MYKRVKKQKKKDELFFFVYTIGQHAGKKQIHDNQFELLFLVLVGPIHPMLNDMMVLLNKNIFVIYHSHYFHLHHFHHQINFPDHIEDHLQLYHIHYNLIIQIDFVFDHNINKHVYR